MAAHLLNRVVADLDVYLKSLSPSSLDLAIRSMTNDDLALFLNGILALMQSNRDFELLQAYLNVFLTVHGDLIIQDSRLKSVLSDLHHKQQLVWSRMEEHLQRAECMIDYIRHQ